MSRLDSWWSSSCPSEVGGEPLLKTRLELAELGGRKLCLDGASSFSSSPSSGTNTWSATPSARIRAFTSTRVVDSDPALPGG